MCHPSCIDFGKKYLKEEYFKDKTVIEVGAYDVNGSLRSVVESFGPRKYIGVDLHMGPGVNQICKVEDLVKTFGKNSFDALICTELLEHVRDWKRVIHNLKQIVKPEGMLLITTRSVGFGYHGYPFDFWRYEISDFQKIFCDFEIHVLERDYEAPGIFLLAKKPLSFVEKVPAVLNLYSIVLEKRSSTLVLNLNWWILKMLMKRFGANDVYLLSRVLHYYNHPFDFLHKVWKRIKEILRRKEAI
jgi:SAM-dependent methyltransferase